MERGPGPLIRSCSPVVDALADPLLSLLDGVVITWLIAGRQMSVLANKGGRWLRHHRRHFRRRAPLVSPIGAQDGPAAVADPGRFLLVRIIGNDLKPLHDPEQSLNNLRFILENEQPLPGCEKRWLLNRISDQEVLCRLRSLLETHGCGYDVIPFEPEGLRAASWDWAVLPCHHFLLSRRYRWLPLDQQQAWLLALYRLKNNVLMHNNGARNRALELARNRDGRTRPDWILPWDGNCFLTPEGWNQLREAMTVQPWADYFHVPMQRISSNQQLLDPGFRADPCDEPQLIFSVTAAEQFNTAYPYGRRPKVELFWRLGLPGPWDDWPDEPWDQPRRPRLEPLPDCPRAGWVARLQAGGNGSSPQSAVRIANAAQASRRRSSARNLAIQATILRSLPPDPFVLQQAALATHWQAPLKHVHLQPELVQGAQDSATLLRSWLHWRDSGGPPSVARMDQLIHALIQVVWFDSLPSLPHHQRAFGLSKSELQRLFGLLFASGRSSLRPRVHHRLHRSGAGALTARGPSPVELMPLSLLSDLLLWVGDDHWPAFAAWRSALMQDWSRRQESLSLGLSSGDRCRFLLASALLHRHLGCLVESVNCLLPLLSSLVNKHPAQNSSGHVCWQEASAQPSLLQQQDLTNLLLILSIEFGLIDSTMAVETSTAGEIIWQPLLRSPLAFDQLS